jgi:hypothetical protein
VTLTRGRGSARDQLRDDHQHGHEELGDKVAEPQGGRVGQADDAHRPKSAHTGQEHGKAEKQHERPLLAHRYRRPQADQAAAEVDAC